MFYDMGDVDGLGRVIGKGPLLLSIEDPIYPRGSSHITVYEVREGSQTTTDIQRSQASNFWTKDHRNLNDSVGRYDYLGGTRTDK